MRILFFGDVVGKIGRRGMKEVASQLKEELKADFVIANVENLAHGTGVTKKTLKQLEDAGVDFFTSGNHIWKKEEAKEILVEQKVKLIRPDNYIEKLPGTGATIIEIKKKKVLMVNLVGQAFMHEEFNSPFVAIDNILEKYQKDKPDIIIIDFHAEATSEKNALGWHVDGRVSAIVGTHTHVPTADAKILTNGTGYITDVGMVGAKNSIIGGNKDEILESFLSGDPFSHNIAETGVCQVNAVLITIDAKTSKTKKIERVDREVEIC
ncbi:TIGR00282 family metallophosphoesterase [Patescibacteria group bacterium]|nr:TIGR00282 family metallophosphoesterase [Patescibacteria group bacterium]